ncbi:MAG: TolC family protein [Elusimicrobiales bacterium]|nr:TolC family protein [Elusimicrobiales bacterium]
MEELVFDNRKRLMNKKTIVYCVFSICFIALAQVSFAVNKKPVLVLTEEKAIETALKNNYDILSKKEEIKVSQSIVNQAWSKVFPNISVGANYIRYENHPFIPFENNHGYSLEVSQLLFAGGGVSNAIGASKNNLKAEREGKKELENNIVYGVRQAFYNILLATEFERIRKETLLLTEENLSITQERYKKGESSHYDLLRSGVEVSNSKVQLIKAKNLVKVSRNFLKILLGIDYSKKIEINGKFNYVPQNFNSNDLIKVALSKRPVLKEISLREKAARMQVKSAFSGHLPQAYFSFTDYGNQKEMFTSGRGKYDDYWIAAVALKIPLFDGFLTTAKVKEAKVMVRKVGILKNKLTNIVKIEVINAALNLKAAQDTVESQNENVNRAKEAYEIIQQKYSLGEAAQLDLLDAQLALSVSQISYAQSLCDFTVAGSKLEYVVGDKIFGGVKK